MLCRSFLICTLFTYQVGIASECFQTQFPTGTFAASPPDALRAAIRSVPHVLSQPRYETYKAYVAMMEQWVVGTCIAKDPRLSQEYVYSALTRIAEAAPGDETTDAGECFFLERGLQWSLTEKYAYIHIYIYIWISFEACQYPSLLQLSCKLRTYK